MATLMSQILVMARDRLNEPVPAFWSNPELLRYANAGVRDLWRRLGATNQNFFHQISVAVTQDINATQLTGVPTNVATIHGLEPVDMQTFNSLYYRRKDYNHPDFMSARAANAVYPTSGGTVFYAPTQAGAPVAAPVILVSPMLSVQVALRLTFTPTIGTQLVATDPNPIPGESDKAIVDWTVAYAKGKQTKSQTPDKDVLALYMSEVESITGSQSPRDDSEPEVAEAMFEEWW